MEKWHIIPFEIFHGHICWFLFIAFNHPSSHTMAKWSNSKKDPQEEIFLSPRDFNIGISFFSRQVKIHCRILLTDSEGRENSSWAQRRVEDFVGISVREDSVGAVWAEEFIKLKKSVWTGHVLSHPAFQKDQSLLRRASAIEGMCKGKTLWNKMHCYCKQFRLL